ncbi:MAG TPA: hypothetical protein VG847_06075 [Chitinophagaceae bacterium]|nr:hypothetical protein [Chitinophagaceae bacterium]
MAYTQLQTSDIVINIPDIIIGDTVIKRTATCFNLNYNAANKFVAVQWLVKHYAKNSDGSLGEYLYFIPDWTKESIADNTTMCDVTNGHPIDKTYDTGQKDENGNEIMDYDPAITYTGQYDYFFNLAETQQVNVNALIIAFGQLITNWDKN